MSNISVSIIVCTRNRASSLQHCLKQLDECRIPYTWDVEVIVVDNGSTDNTEEIVRTTKMTGSDLRYFYESDAGLSHARNTGLAFAKGEIILFTDDDVLVERDWIFEMASFISGGTCDAATGLVVLAADLLRPWMTDKQKSWLASTQGAYPPGRPVYLVGASMGFRKLVLNRVPAFDPELGAGALGFGEDYLFGLQLVEAGYRVEFNPGACAVHCLDTSRLQRRQWIRAAARRGQTQGYLLHHWEHKTINKPNGKYLSQWVRLNVRRRIQTTNALDTEGCPPWEMSYVYELEKYKQYQIESSRPRHYAFHALRRLD